MWVENLGYRYKGENRQAKPENSVPRKILISTSRTGEETNEYKIVHEYLLTELIPSWEAAACAATQELPTILSNPKIHYRVHKSPPLVPILSQIDLVQTIPSCLSKICFSIVHSPTSWSF
jgi:hypothetical protein